MALNLDNSTILSPALHLKNSPQALAVEITAQLKPVLGLSGALIKEALYHGLEKQADFEKELIQNGEKILGQRNDDDPMIVVTGRPYNLYDDRLNLRLGRNLARIGIDALPIDLVDRP